MTPYILTPEFLPTESPVEKFESLIWTDRYSRAGDCQLVVQDNFANRTMFREGSFMTLDTSREVMILEDFTASAGLITIKGTSLLHFLRNRILRNTFQNAYNSWSISASSVGEVMAQVVRDMLMSNSSGLMQSNVPVNVGSAETFPRLKLGPIASGVPVTIPLQYGDVYSTLVALAEAGGLGQSLYPSGISENGYDLIYTNYEGRDLTSAQDVYNVVQLTTILDALSDVSEYRSIVGYKNVAHAWAPNVTSPNYYVASEYVDGALTKREFDRRTLYLPCDDIADDDIAGKTPSAAAFLMTVLGQRARDALANNNFVRMVDGTVVPQGSYKLGVDYLLGDIVELRSPAGIISRARVSELVQTQDKNSSRTYPTLSVLSE